MSRPLWCDEHDCPADECADKHDDEPAHSWRRVDLTGILEGTATTPTATVGRRDDGPGMFYRARVHSVASEAEGGKTWLLLLAAIEELAVGNTVMVLDFEDDAAGIAGRLLALGVDRGALRERFAYISPEESIAALGNREDLGDELTNLQPSLVILDGVTEAMTLHGLEMRDNTDVARFGKLLPRWIANQGPAVVLSDHVPKSEDNRGRYSIGGVHKLNAINGASYVLENRRPFGIGMTGRSGVFIAKDRPGVLRRNGLPSHDGLTWFGDLVLRSHDVAFVEASLLAPAQVEDFRPTEFMRRISQAMLKAGQPLSKAGIEERVRGKAQHVRSALAALVDEHYIEVETGPRGARMHRLVKPFEEDE